MSTKLERMRFRSLAVLEIAFSICRFLLTIYNSNNKNKTHVYVQTCNFKIKGNVSVTCVVLICNICMHYIALNNF